MEGNEVKSIVKVMNLRHQQRTRPPLSEVELEDLERAEEIVSILDPIEVIGVIIDQRNVIEL